MNPTPGVKTSEFYITLVIIMLNSFVTSGLLPTEHLAVRMAAAIIAGAAALGYQVSRGMVKYAAHRDAPATPVVVDVGPRPGSGQ